MIRLATLLALHRLPLLAALLLAPGAAGAQPEPAVDPLTWPEPQRAFFQDGPGLLLSAEERSEILGSTRPGASGSSGRFLDRDPLPETPENELRLGIERRARLVQRNELPSPRDARAQLLFLRGRPAERLVVDCAAAFRPLEIWTYRGLQRCGEDPRTWCPLPPLPRALPPLAAHRLQARPLHQRDGVLARPVGPPEAAPQKAHRPVLLPGRGATWTTATGVDGLARRAGEGRTTPRTPAPRRPARISSGSPRGPDRWLWAPADRASWAREAAATVAAAGAGAPGDRRASTWTSPAARGSASSPASW